MSDPRLSSFPRDLARAARLAIADGTIPILLAHPDWQRPAPTVLWLHGRTAHKELDPGRYLRWLRAGIATCAIDLPSHGERIDVAKHDPRFSLDTIEQAIGEIDRVVESLAAPEHKGVFDLDRLAIGGMSMGGIVTLRRLCEPHTFRCAAVEGTTGWLEGLYFPERFAQEAGAQPPAWVVRHEESRVRALSAAAHLHTFRPLPLLMLHSEADRMLPFAAAKGFAERLRARYSEAGSDPSLIELQTWPETGAPEEHIGFGRFSNDAKNRQTDFLKRWLAPVPVNDSAADQLARPPASP